MLNTVITTTPITTGRGFHTFEVQKQLSHYEYNYYKDHLANTCNGTRLFYLKPNKKGKKPFKETDKSKNKIYQCDVLTQRGVQIRLAYFANNGYPYYCIILVVNPKRVTDNNNFLSASYESDMPEFCDRINRLLADIGINEDFRNFMTNRIDYCCNCRFADESTAELYMKLMKQGAVLNGFNVYLTYSESQHRFIESKAQVYASNKSIELNLYNKFIQMIEQPPKYPLNNLEAYRGVIRFEIHCLKPKTYTIKASNHFPNRNIIHYLSEYISEKSLAFYLKKIFCTGDFYTITAARNLVNCAPYRSEAKQSMLNLLDITSEKRNLQEALTILENTGFTPSYIKCLLGRFNNIGVNPVTIPISWNIQSLPSPLNIVMGNFPKDLYLDCLDDTNDSEEAEDSESQIFG